MRPPVLVRDRPNATCFYGHDRAHSFSYTACRRRRFTLSGETLSASRRVLGKRKKPVFPENSVFPENGKNQEKLFPEIPEIWEKRENGKNLNINTNIDINIKKETEKENSFFDYLYDRITSDGFVETEQEFLDKIDPDFYTSSREHQISTLRARCNFPRKRRPSFWMKFWNESNFAIRANLCYNIYVRWEREIKQALPFAQNFNFKIPIYLEFEKP